MKQKSRKLMSVMLTLALVLSLLPGIPFTAKAADPTFQSFSLAGSNGDATRTGTVTDSNGMTSTITFTKWDSTDSLPTSAGSYYLTGNVTLNYCWFPTSTNYGSTVDGGTVNLCLNGCQIIENTDWDCIQIDSGVTLNLYDESGNAGAITHADGKKGHGVRINGGTLNLYGGAISGNTSKFNGGGVYIGNEGVLNMYGGAISGNTVAGDAGFGGGGVCNNAGTITMTGGEISGNTAGYNGGGVYIDGGGSTLNLEGYCG